MRDIKLFHRMHALQLLEANKKQELLGNLLNWFQFAKNLTNLLW